jgi:hypothetical protein
MEDSPTDTPGLWIPERNEYDSKFVRVFGDTIPTKKHVETASEERKHLFKDLVKGGMETQTSSVRYRKGITGNNLFHHAAFRHSGEGVGKKREL